MPTVEPNAAAPALALPDLNGAVHTLAQLRADRPVLLCFYKIECPTCRLTLPFVEKLHQQYGSALHVVGVAQNPTSDVVMYTHELGLTFTQLIDNDPFDASFDYGVEFTPTTFFVDRAGTVRHLIVAWDRAGYNELSALLARETGLAYAPASTAGDGAPDSRPG
jgi:peroxiredoxin